MVFMQRRHEGHPAAAMLLLFSMFAFAFVFHVVTRPDATVAAYFDTQLAAYPGAAVVSPRPAVTGRRVVDRPKAAQTHAPFMAAATPEALATPSRVDPPTPATLVITGHAPAAPLLSPIDPIAPLHTPDDGGAVTRAIGHTRSALRSAFKKAF
jgi:hypothetical protein